MSKVRKVANKLTLKEYKREINKIHRSWSSSTRSENYDKANEIRQAVSKIRGLQTYRPPLLFDGPYRLNITVYGKTRADEDNIRKAINDALQGTATRNDRDSRGGSITLCGC